MFNFHIVINHDISVTVSGNVWKDHSRVICLHSVMFSQFLKDGQYLATGWNFFAGDSECGCVMHPHQLHKFLCFPQVLIADSGQSVT